MEDRTQGALLLAVGGVAVRLGVTDAANNFIRPGYRWLLVVAGAALALLGLVALIRALRADAPASEAPAHDEHGHDHARGPRVAWFLTLPLFAILLVAPPPLGSFAASRQSGVVTTTATSFPPLPAAEDGAVPLTMGQYTVRALYDSEATLEGARVRLTGFVSEQLDAGAYHLTRFQLACCAADGTAISVEVRGDQAQRPVDQWFEVEGTWAAREGHVLGELTVDKPVLIAESVVPIAQPAEPYEY